jgi:SSS family solute:Na+ symporter
MSSKQKEVLNYIREGFHVMSEITDLLAVDSSVSNQIIEGLEQSGYIRRHSLSGAGFYSFYLTEKGTSQFPELAEKDLRLQEAGINETDIELLTFFKENRHYTNDQLVSKFPMDVNLVATHLMKLVRLGYLNEIGLWRMRVVMSSSGDQLLQRLKAV